MISNGLECLCYLFCIASLVGNTVISFPPWLMPSGKIPFLLSNPSALQTLHHHGCEGRRGEGEVLCELLAFKTTAHKVTSSGQGEWGGLYWGLFPFLVLLVSFSNH